jgi:hypothetical protein
MTAVNLLKVPNDGEEFLLTTRENKKAGRSPAFVIG